MSDLDTLPNKTYAVIRKSPVNTEYSKDLYVKLCQEFKTPRILKTVVAIRKDGYRYIIATKVPWEQIVSLKDFVWRSGTPLLTFRQDRL